jgi:hypothetical protein
MCKNFRARSGVPDYRRYAGFLENVSRQAARFNRLAAIEAV